MTWRIDPIIVVAVALVFGVGLCLWWWLPKWQVNHMRLTIYDPKAWADVEDNFRKTIGQLLVGAMVLGGAGLAATVAYRQLMSQQQASRDLVISNQVSKGFEQLGNKDSVVVRLGGIYALEGVMNASAQYYKPVLEALCAFVRDNTRTDNGDGPPATDIQAALTVIGRRIEVAESGFDTTTPKNGPDLSYAHIPKANLQDANLIRADLRRADLREANLIRVNLRRADLTGADLTDTSMSLSNEKLSLSSEVRADLSDADLTGANLTRTKLNFSNLKNAILTGATLREAILSNTDLRGAISNFADLSGALLSFSDLTGADLSAADLSRAKFDSANLTKAIVAQIPLDVACGTNVKLDPGLGIKPCLH